MDPFLGVMILEVKSAQSLSIRDVSFLFLVENILLDAIQQSHIQASEQSSHYFLPTAKTAVPAST